jgi:hypothetical protein
METAEVISIDASNFSASSKSYSTYICRKIIMQITSKPSVGMILCLELYHVVDEDLNLFPLTTIERD